MSDDSSFNSSEHLRIAEDVAEAVINKFAAQHPELREPNIPAPLKWAGAIIAGLFTAGTATLAFWLVSTVSEMQVTLARMDERMVSGMVKDSRVDDLDRRVSKLEDGEQGNHSAKSPE